MSCRPSLFSRSPALSEYQPALCSTRNASPTMNEFTPLIFCECISSPSSRLIMETSHSIGISIHLWQLAPAISHQFVPLTRTSEVSRQFPSTFSSTYQVHISLHVGKAAKDLVKARGNNTHCSPLVNTPPISLERK